MIQLMQPLQADSFSRTERMNLFLKYLTDIPAGVTINEAVELTKQYASDDEYAFVNGVLGAVAKDLGRTE